MPENTIDSLQIEIGAISKEAAESLKSLQATLKSLDALGSGTGIKNLYNSLKAFEKINLSELASQVSKITDSVKKPIEVKANIVKGKVNNEALLAVETVSGGTPEPVDTLDNAIRTSTEATEFTETIGTAAKEAAQSFEELADPIRRAAAEITNAELRLKLLVDEYNKLSAGGNVEDKKMLNLEKSIISTTASLDKLKDKYAQINGGVAVVNEGVAEVSKTSEKAAKSGNKFFNSLKRIAFYRLIRTVLKEIAQGFREGIQAFAQYNERANATVSSLMNTGTQLKNTLGITFANVLYALEPLITAVADGIIDIANGINAAMAAMNGDTQFAKAKKSTDSYAESLKKAKNQLFSFDKFEVLSGSETSGNWGGDDPENPFDYGDIGEVDSGLLKAGESLAHIKDLINDIFASVGPILSEVLPPILELLAYILEDVSSLMTEVSGSQSGFLEYGKQLFELIIGIYKAIRPLLGVVMKVLPIVFAILKPILDVLTWVINKAIAPIINFISKVYMFALDFRNIINIIKTIFMATVGVIKDIASFIKGIVASLVKVFGVIKDIVKLTLKLIPKKAIEFGEIVFSGIGKFAEGGFPNQGQMFVANEAGPELVGNIGGRTAVANNDIIVDAIERASYRGMVAAIQEIDTSRNGGGDAVININGREFARATYEDFNAERQRRGGR